MHEEGLRILFDQNIPFAVAAWMRSRQPTWMIWHVKDLCLEGHDSLIIIDDKKIRVRNLTAVSTEKKEKGTDLLFT